MAKDSEFERQAAGREPSLLQEFAAFIRENKKFWLVPIFLTLLLLGLVIAMGSSGAAPFIYTLF